ncbi:MAG: DUF5050 domain-containing protein, partial [Caloramator sp.]|nr:DUF5050 domain-containing protein [Caloramator sp.]
MRRFLSFLVSISIVLGILPKPTLVFAAGTTNLPINSTIVGEKLFTKDYIQENIDSVNSEIRNNPGRVFYVDDNGNIKNEYGQIVTEQHIVKTNIRILTVYSTSNNNIYPNGTKFVADENGIFVKIDNNDSNKRVGYAIVDIQFIDSIKTTLDISIKEINHIPEAYYYIVGTGNFIINADTNRLSSLGSDYQLNKRTLNERYSLVNNNPIENIYIAFYNSSGYRVATGTIREVQNGRLAVLLYVDNSIPKDIYTNVKGNISNGGFAATDGEYIYYSNSADGGKIYKRPIDGSDAYPICNDNAKYINVVDDFIYYSNMSDGGKIYRIKTDGTSRSKINNVLSSYINVVDSDIYYVNGKRSNRIYRLKTYNTDPQNEGTLVTSDKAAYLVATSNMLYYSNLSDKGRLYSINISGGVIGTRIGYSTITGSTKLGVRYISVTENGDVYCSGYDSKLYRLNTKVNRLEQLNIQTNITKKGNNSSPQIVNDNVGFINAVDSSSIYYRSSADSGRIYKRDLDGTSKKVVDDVASGINVIGDILFYLKGGKLYIYDIKTQGKPIAASKFKPEGKIVKVDDLEQVPYGTPLPDSVSAIFDSGQVKDVLVAWDTKNVKSKNGVFTYTGTIIGYGTKVQMSAIRYSKMVSPENIKVFNEEGIKADSVVVENLQSGEEILVYDENDKLLGKAKADKKGVATLAKIELEKTSGEVKVYRVTPGYAPSVATIYIYPGEAPSILSVEYIAQEKKYGVTYKGLSGNVKYAVASENQVIELNNYIPFNDNDDNKPKALGSNIYYFKIPSTSFEGLDKNRYLRIAYDETNSTPSKPYTMLAQSEPNVTYNFLTGTFDNISSNIECRIEGSNEWFDSNELRYEPYRLMGKVYVEFRLKASGNKMPGVSKLVSMIPMPKVVINSKGEKLFDSDDKNTYSYDVINNVFASKYIANTDTTNISISINIIPSSQTINYYYKINNETTESRILTGNIPKDNLKQNEINTLTIIAKTSDNKKLGESNIKFRIFNQTIPQINPQIAGVVGR